MKKKSGTSGNKIKKNYLLCDTKSDNACDNEIII